VYSQKHQKVFSSDYGSEGYRFESCRDHNTSTQLAVK